MSSSRALKWYAVSDYLATSQSRSLISGRAAVSSRGEKSTRSVSTAAGIFRGSPSRGFPPCEDDHLPKRRPGLDSGPRRARGSGHRDSRPVVEDDSVDQDEPVDPTRTTHPRGGECAPPSPQGRDYRSRLVRPVGVLRHAHLPWRPPPDRRGGPRGQGWSTPVRLATTLRKAMVGLAPPLPPQTVCSTCLVGLLQMLAPGGTWVVGREAARGPSADDMGVVLVGSLTISATRFFFFAFRPSRVLLSAFSRPQSPHPPFFPIPKATVRADPSAVEHTRITDRSVLYHTKASIYSPYYRSTFVARPYVPVAHRPPGTSLWSAPPGTPIADLLAVATDPDQEAFPYGHSEQWLAASLADLFGDALIAQRVRSPFVTPTHARRLSRSVSGFVPAVWEAERAEVALVGSLAKFAADPALAAALVATASGPAGPRVLVGASRRDREWGVGLSMNDPGVEIPELWRGNNMLGVVLARVRDVLMAQPGR